jgi:sulfur relay (sulfurtransferase) complex TusBCD TusD component (DsrE family)
VVYSLFNFHGYSILGAASRDAFAWPPAPVKEGLNRLGVRYNFSERFEKEVSMARFLFVLGAGLGNANNPTRCMLFAQMAHMEGHEVSIFLIDEGVVFGRKGIAENAVAASGEEMSESLQYLIDNKVPIYVCTPCAKARQVTEDVFIEGAQMATGKKLIELAAGATVFNF